MAIAAVADETFIFSKTEISYWNMVLEILWFQDFSQVRKETM